MNDESFAEQQPFDDSSSISDTESFSVPPAGAAGEEEGPGTTGIEAEELCQCRAVYEVEIARLDKAQSHLKDCISFLKTSNLDTTMAETIMRRV